MVKEDSSYQSGFGNGLARTFVQMEDGTIYVTGNSKFGRLVKNEFGLVEYEYLLHNLPDSIDYKRQIIWGALEHEGNVIFYTPNFVFSWDGEKFNNVWKFSDYAGGRASYGKIHAFSKAGNTLYTRRWGYGLYKLIDNKFQYIKNSEFLSQNRIELF